MERVTATLDEDTVAKIRRVAGPRGVSNFLNEAARERLARLELRGLLDELDVKHGPVPREIRTEVARAGKPISLTSTEFELLRFLMRNQGRALTRTEILDRVWNYDFAGRTSIVDLYISYLRKKIDAGMEPMIHTVRGVGYMLRPPK